MATTLSERTPARPVRRRKLYEEVALGLEDMIRAGNYAPETELPSERELVEMFGVGRPAVREALFALERRGLVSVRSGKKAVVAEPTPELLINELSGVARNLLAQDEGSHHFQAARVLFEAAIARQAARQVTAAQLKELETALAANRKSIGSTRSFELTDIEFHYALARIPENPIFTAVHSGLLAWLTEQRRISNRAPEAEHLAYEAHQRIFEAVAARDPDRAEAEMTTHLEQVGGLYWAVRAAQRDRVLDGDEDPS